MAFAPFKKLLIIGLDALPWSVLRPMMAAGCTPTLKRLIDEGASGTLRSTIPDQTPSAWTTFMTGVQPTTHGIINFHKFDPVKNAAGMNDATRMAERNIYHFFSAAGLKVGVVMQPMTFPPFPVNGYLLTGFDSPGVSAAFAHPRGLEPEVLKLCPDHAQNFTVGKAWDHDQHGTDDAIFEKNLEILNKRMVRVTDLALDLEETKNSDVLMVYYEDPDYLFHTSWRWCDEATFNENPRRLKAVQAFFRKMDEQCARLIKAGSAEGRLTLVLSDHGQRANAVRVRLNSILMQLGYLVPAMGFLRLTEGLRRLSNKIRRKRDLHGPAILVDWHRTRAFMPFQSSTAFIYINLRGRHPHGSVPPEQREQIRDQLIAELRAYRDPATGANYFADVGAYHGAAEHNLPDIYVQPAAGVGFTKRAKKRGPIVQPARKLYAGQHDPDGLYILHGAGVKAGAHQNAHIVDMAPTLMAALGQGVPTYMEGRVLDACFSEPPPLAPRPMTWASGAGGAAYSKEQEALVEARLAELGYLD